MKVLVFEWLYGGGLWIDGNLPDPNCPFQSQGQRMLKGFTNDLTLAGFEVYLLRDARLNRIESISVEATVANKDDVTRSLKRFSELVNFIVLIAPECEGCLFNACCWFGPWAEKLVSPDASFVQLTSDKNKTARWLSRRGISVARGGEIARRLKGESIIKPALGAGSEQVRLIKNRSEVESLAEPGKWRVEEFVKGRPASVSVLCGHTNEILLSPTWQILDGDFGVFLSSEPIKCETTRARALELARQTIHALPKTRGYVGIDMVIGERECVVDVNPRLTTSYCHLREIEDFNIAAAMMNVACC